MLPDETKITNILKPIINPWYNSIKNPKKAQETILTKLLKDYEKTDFGLNHNASKIKDIKSFQINFPIVDYKILLPYLSKVREGNYKVILAEDPDHWVMTRGSTGNSKVIPATPTHLKQIFSCGARAIINYALRTKNYEVFTGDILNLNFPSSVHDMKVKGKKITFGYS